MGRTGFFFLGVREIDSDVEGFPLSAVWPVQFLISSHFFRELSQYSNLSTDGGDSSGTLKDLEFLCEHFG